MQTCTPECFVLTAVTFDGVTVYPARDLAPLYADHLASEASLQDLVRIAQAVTDRYRADGYFLSRAVVPSQPGEAGAAHIRVYEGYIAEVVFEGDRSPAVEALFTGLGAKRPTRLADLERRQLLANDLPGITVRTRLEPVLDDPARHRLVVTTKRDAVAATLYTDNRGAHAQGPWQAYGWVGIQSALRDGDQLGFGVLTTPANHRELTYAEAAYGVPLGEGRLRVSVSGSRSETGRDAVFGSRSRSLGLHYLWPLKRSRRGSVWIDGGFDARSIAQSWRGASDADDELRVLRVGLSGDQAWRAGRSSFGVQLSRGVEALGATRSVSTRHSRWDADGGFWKLHAQASHYVDLSRVVGLFLAGEAQYAPDPLLASEEMSAGGLPFGRAYNYSEIMGESGVAGLAELRLGAPVRAGPVSFAQTYAFVDGARVWNPTNLAGYRQAQLASAGVGLRLTLKPAAVVRVELAKPIAGRPIDQGDRRWRPFVSLSTSF